MDSLATRRVIGAAAKLEPADRALFDLWINRGLDDERLTALTGLSTGALNARREKIIAQLAADLGLPDAEIRGALARINTNDQALSPPGPNGEADVPSRNGAATVTHAAEGPRRRRRLSLGLLALVVMVAVVALVAGGGTSSPGPRRAAGSPSTPTTGTRAPTVATAAHRTGNAAPVPFAGLPGGLVHASGFARVTGKANLKLNLTVRGLPAVHAGHYELWLYNSVLDSQPLARLRNGHRGLTVRLPANVRRYRWIDISLQPVGTVNHSGESELRAINPARPAPTRGG